MMMNDSISFYENNAEQVKLLSSRNDFLGKLQKRDIEALSTIDMHLTENNNDILNKLTTKIGDLIDLDSKIQGAYVNSRNKEFNEIDRLERILEELDNKENEANLLLEERIRYKENLENQKFSHIKSLAPVSQKRSSKMMDLISQQQK
jgi:hypothetical protein